jgi:hypothetical protein
MSDTSLSNSSLYPEPMIVILLRVFSSSQILIMDQIPEKSMGALTMNILYKVIVYLTFQEFPGSCPSQFWRLIV